MTARVVVIGGGQAGVQAADSLRSAAPNLAVTIIAGEARLPYQRPPLSKSLWSEDLTRAAAPLRGADFFTKRSIRLSAGVKATRIDRVAKRVQLDNGDTVQYSALILATGARPRELPLPGRMLQGVHRLRTLDDALALQAELRRANALVVVGGGFIGLEIAASAVQHGQKVTVLETQRRLLERAVTPDTSRWLEDFHRSAGVDVRLSTSVKELLADAKGHVMGVVAATGERLAADVVVLGVGVVPNVELAADSGLSMDNGVCVDRTLRTDDPSIWAIGDCARFPLHATGAPTRLESVQNATDQARLVAKNVLAFLNGGSQECYQTVPWFWSDQASLRLQISGVGDTADGKVVVREYAEDKRTMFVYENDSLTVVETINAPADHFAARRLIADGVNLDPALASDPGVSLSSLIQRPTR